jgi:GH25 family lysozyme M1 (1,4-beta-N-acetylmuramidase)
MREFTPTEVQILTRLLDASTGLPVRLEQFLEQVFFSEQDGRALILQPAGRFGYLYLKPDVYDDERARGEQTRRLVELMMLFVYLRDQGIMVVNGVPRDEQRRMRFLSGAFRDPKPLTTGAGVVLNQKGDYSFHPETICDQADNVIYKGVRLESDMYDLIARNASGLMFVSPSVKDLIPPPPPPEPEPAPPRRRHRAGWWPLPVTAAGIVVWLLRGAPLGLPPPAVDPLPPAAGASSTTTTSAVQTAGHAPEPVTASAGDTDAMHFGVDLSRWNAGELGPAIEAAGIDFIFVRATYGRAKDIDFEKNWALLQQKGVIRGAYHFYLVHDDAIEQAESYLAAIGDSEPLEIAPAVDFEELSFPARGTPPDVAAVQNGLLSALAHIEARTGRVPILYTNVTMGNTYLNDTRFARYPLWIADWSTRTEPTLPEAWKNVGYRFWQRTSQYALTGTTGSATDFDVFKGLRNDIYR